MKSCSDLGKTFRFGAVLLCTVFAGFLAVNPARAQSSDQNYPTPVTANEIAGEIRARDIGDSRLTTYYYTFDGSQGDLFVNIVSRNLTGDIDIFTLKDLRPLTKVVLYADLAENETGRVIYLRKPENLLLRVQGRTPNDDPATFRIKFAGSFVASTREPGSEQPALPTVTAENESGIRVNSVGTILEVPKPSPSPVETVASAEETVTKTDDAVPAAEEVKPAETEKKADIAEETTPPADAPAEPERKVEVVITDNIPTAKSEPPARTRRSARNRRRADRKPVPPKAEEAPAETVAETETPATAEPADPLANVRLVVLFKDGKRIERPMTEVFRFTVDKGVLTVVSKDGRVGRYPMLDISEVTIK